MVEVCSAWNRATGGANSSHQPPTLPDMPSHSTRENGSYRAQKRGLSVGVLWNFLRTGGRRLAALAVRWLVAGSVPARFACPGQDGGAAGRGLSGVFRRLRVPTMRRAGAGRASAAIPGTGGRAGAPAHSWRYAAAAVLLAFAALLALPLQAEAQTAYVSNNGQSGSTTVNTNASISQAQGFTTGSQSGGYPLSSVGLKFSSGAANAANLVVAIYSAATGGGPDTVEYTLLNPSTLAIDGTEQLFSAPANATLSAGTTYYVVTSSGGGNTYGAHGTTQNGEDSGVSTGWSIADTRYFKNSSTDNTWGTSPSGKLRISIYPPTTTVTPTVTISRDKTSAVFKEHGITYTVTRTGSTTAALSVSVALTQTKNFLATSNLTQTVTIGAGDSTGAFTISAADFQHFATGTKVEGGTLTATVQDILGYDPGTPSSVGVDIVIGVMIRFDMASYSVAEGAGTLTFKLIARTGTGAPQPTYDSDFEIATPSGSATAGTDYSFNPGGQTIEDTDFTADGSVWKAEQTYNIAITNDTLDETDETFEIQLYRRFSAESFSFVDASGNSCGDTCTASVTIVDDDAPIPEVTFAAGSATEGSPVTFTVTLSTTTSVPVTVRYSTSVESDDTATLSASAPGGADFVNVNNAAITIQAGSTTGTIPISTTNDTVDEPDETFTVTLGTPTNGTLGTTTAAKGTIADNDATPQATLVLNPTSISEDGGSSTVTATLDRASSEATTITVSAMAVSPAVAADFTLSGSTLTIAAGSTTSTGTVTITANDNSVAGGNKSVTVSATAANDLAVTAPSNKTLTITEDDGASNRVTLTVSPATVAEDATGSARTVTVTATLNGSALASDAVVTVSVDADTATEGDDFTAVEDFTVTITGGSTSGSATFDLIPNNDTTDEPDETVKVTGRTTVSGLTVLPSAGVPVTIADNDATPAVTLVLTPASIPEDGGTTTLSTVTATLDHASSEATTIDISAAAGTNTEAGDFTVTTNKRLTIAAEATTSTGTVTVRAVNDGIYTGNKSVSVSGTATNDLNIAQPVAQTLTITEDDTASTEVTLSVSPASIPEGATGNARRVTVTATLNNAARPDATVVNVTVAGVTATAGDFTAVPPFDVTIPAGDSSATAMFTLAPVDDDTDEAGETVGVTGTTTAPGLTVGPAVAPTVTIADNDATPTVTLVLAPASIPENGGTSTVTATLDHPSSEDTTVTVSAAAGTNTDSNDFTKSGSTLTIAAGATASTGTVTIAATNNTVADGDKNVTVSATAANALAVTAPSNRTLAITDDEVASTGLTLTVSPDFVSESATGNARTVTVTATLNGSAREDRHGGDDFGRREYGDGGDRLRAGDRFRADNRRQEHHRIGGVRPDPAARHDRRAGRDGDGDRGRIGPVGAAGGRRDGDAHR